MTAALASPALAGFFPDPSICYVDGTFYLANSSFEYFPAVPLHSSTDLRTWTPIGHAIDRPGQLDLSRATDSGGVYAPALRHHDGVFYLATTSIGQGDGFGTFYLRADDPADAWSDPVFLPEARGFDPSIFFDHDGASWWVQCRERDDARFWGDTEVWVRRIDLEHGRFEGPETIIGGPVMQGAAWAEGPHIHRRGRWYYLLTAEGGTAASHAVMVSRSDSVTGPYVPFANNPLLTHRHLGRTAPISSVGHMDWAEGSDGWHAVALATRPVDGGVVLGRETFTAALTWEDDWPVVNPGVGVLGPIAAPTVSEVCETARLEHLISERGPHGSICDDDTGVVLTAVDSGAGPAGGPGVWRRLLTRFGTVSVTVERLDPEAVACVALRQSDDHQVFVAIDATHARLVERRAGTDAVIAVHPLADADGAVTVVARLHDRRVDFSIRGAHEVALGRAAIDVLTTEVAGGFVGTVFGARPSGTTGARTRLKGWTQSD
jgi:xylan 1,4-beta-xylosidase